MKLRDVDLLLCNADYFSENAINLELQKTYTNIVLCKSLAPN